MGIDLNSSFNEQVLIMAKIFAIIFALVHLLFGLILVRQIFRMNDIVRTRLAPLLVFFSVVYLIFLSAILLLLLTI
jgi:hypothetical protein